MAAGPPRLAVMSTDDFLGKLPILSDVRELARVAYVSRLTDLLNGSALAYFQKQVATAEKFSAAFLDLAGFKRINDDHGHAAGDAALRAVGLALADLETDSVIPFHKSGDEFVVLARPATALDGFLSAAKRMITDDVEFEHGGKKIPGLRVTIGYAMPETGVSLENLIQRAEEAMRAAKFSQAGALQWRADFKQDPVKARRKKCAACGATTDLQVPESKLRATAPTICANCGEPLP